MKSENVTSAKEDPKKIQLNKQNDTSNRLLLLTCNRFLLFTSRTKTNNGSNISRYGDNSIMLFFIRNEREKESREKENSSFTAGKVLGGDFS